MAGTTAPPFPEPKFRGLVSCLSPHAKHLKSPLPFASARCFSACSRSYCTQAAEEEQANTTRKSKGVGAVAGRRRNQHNLPVACRAGCPTTYVCKAMCRQSRATLCTNISRLFLCICLSASLSPPGPCGWRSWRPKPPCPRPREPSKKHGTTQRQTPQNKVASAKRSGGGGGRSKSGLPASPPCATDR